MNKLDKDMAQQFIADAYEQYQETGDLSQTAQLFGFTPATLRTLFERMHGEGENRAEFTIFVLDRGSSNIVILGGY